MQTTNLSLLRELRTQEKALKARIDEIMPAAADEAVTVLASQGLDRGEFEVPAIGTFQLQRTGQGQNASSEPRQGLHFRHERLPQDLRRTQPGQTSRRNQTNGQSNRLKAQREKKQKRKPFG